MTPPSALERLELQRTEKYVVYDAIASGGMASVHLGVLYGALGFSRVVAIKRLHRQFTTNPRFVAMLIDEARLASRISHVNVVTTLDILESASEVFVIMEYLRGASLAKLTACCMARGELVPLRVAVPILVGALRGLDAAHEATDLDGSPLGIVHRDVSPSNIIVGIAGTPRVIDFGVAHALGQLDQTKAGEFKGKLAYAAPEQVEEGGRITRQTDVFAIGIILWELLVGERLFGGDTDLERFRKVDACRVPEVAELFAANAKMRSFRSAEDIAALAPIAMRALSRAPAARYATAAEMASALEGAIDGALPYERGAWVRELAEQDLVKENSIIRRIEEQISLTSHGARQHVARNAKLARNEESTVSYGKPEDLAPAVEPGLPRVALFALALAALVGAALGSVLAITILGR